ncbi:MAG TPA: multicopper oxidase domain-containing protein [Fimbriimonadaceae bacterium]|nr:multicopper oxidase domain-containing protein [Fimbriimonadaceae bacterium]
MTQTHRLFGPFVSGEAGHDRFLTRRAFLQTSALLAGSVAFVGMPSPGAAQVTRNPLKIPPTASPYGFNLTCGPATSDLGGGTISNVLAYNGQFPGPTFIGWRGDTIFGRIINNLSEETITHWHGMVVDHENDGGPHHTVIPGASRNYKFPIIQRAALNWYHPHPHMMTARQVNLGLAGAFIVRDAEEMKLKLPFGPYEVPLIIRDATLRGNNLDYNAPASGFNGRLPMVNGTLNPKLNVDRGYYRFRVLNGANARVFRLALSNGAPFRVIGNDGGFLPAPVSVTQITLGMGERLDLLVDFRTLAAGATVMLRCLDAGWDLLQFVGTGVTAPTVVPPTIMPKIETLVGPSVPTRTFSFDGMSRINGQEFDMNRTDFTVPFGVVERWRFVSGGNGPHPIHVHGASFQVVSRSGGRGALMPWEAGWKDTVLLLDGESVDILIRFDGYRGLYVLHCHLLEHEDHGMMANFVVV